MCGICGFLNLKESNQQDRTQILTKMCDSITHRGPDDEGIYLDDYVALGVRRLKIIDLETGQQPIHNEDKTIWIVFNGEIYNFLELREILEKQGHRFYTHSDTEVIVHLYEQYGDDFVHHLNGMFAFAIWDKPRKRLILGRDRIGKKPLHYTIFNHKFIFASEIKAILKYPGISKEIDFSSLTKYFAYEFVPAPHSIFKGIKKLLPGHLIFVREGKITEANYWDIDLSEDKKINEEDLPQRLKELLKRAVKQRLISDVPLGVFLSGGIDSSTVVALMSSVSTQRIRTFTIGFKERSFDEMKYARQVANIFGTEHHEHILASKQMFELIPKIAQVLDEPIGDASIIPTYLLSFITRKDITVALSGDGGDELFAGYPTYQAHKFAHYYKKIPEFIRKGVIENIIKRLPVSFDNFSLDFKAKKFISGIPYLPLIRHYIWLGSFTPEEEWQLFKPEFKEQISQDKIFSDLVQYINESHLSKLIDQTMYLDLKLYLQDDILVKVDRASMACSLEVRAPFLDYNVVEFVASLPSDLKLKGLKSKYILKKSMQGILPNEILNRKKKGFGIPVAKWINNELKPLVLDVLSESGIREEGFFNYNYIQELLKQHFEGKKDNRKLIWTLLMFELWYKEHIDGCVF